MMVNLLLIEANYNVQFYRSVLQVSWSQFNWLRQILNKKIRLFCGYEVESDVVFEIKSEWTDFVKHNYLDFLSLMMRSAGVLPETDKKRIRFHSFHS